MLLPLNLYHITTHKWSRLKKCTLTFLSGHVTRNYVLIKTINVWSKFIVLISHNKQKSSLYIYGPPHH